VSLETPQPTRETPLIATRTSTSRRSVWKAWLWVLLWLGVIAIESTTYLSSANTGRFLYPVLHFLFGVDPVSFPTWHFFLRKGGHVFGYGMLSWLLFRAVRVTALSSRDPNWSMVWSLVAIAGTAFVASMDEWHQSFLPSRTGTIHDVLLDTTAALVIQILVFLLIRVRRKGGKFTDPAQDVDGQHPSENNSNENLTTHFR
jgi:VanZ family protein